MKARARRVKEYKGKRKRKKKKEKKKKKKRKVLICFSSTEALDHEKIGRKYELQSE